MVPRSLNFMKLFNQSTDTIHVTVTSSARHADLTMAPPIEGQSQSGCIVLEQEFDPEDNPQNIISKETKFWISMLSSGFVALLFFLGVPGNLLSAAVFYRQGLRERINLCIFCLALVDLVVITVTFFLAEEEVYRSLIGPSFFFIKYFVGLTGSSWVSMFLSTVIAAERCFCVVSPLRALHVLSTRTLAVVIVSTSAILMTGLLIIAGPKHTDACVFDPVTNTTSYIIYVTEYYLENKEILDLFDIFVYATALPVLCFIIIVITTIVTAAKLQSAVRWREKFSSVVTKSSETNMVALTRMLIGTSVLFIVCSFPILAVQMTMFAVGEFKHGGHYHNLTVSIWGLINVFRCVNSSLNFFIYYKMGSRFRQTLKQLFFCKGDTKIGQLRSDLVDPSPNSSEQTKQCISAVSERAARH